MEKKIAVTKEMNNRKIEYVLSGDMALSGNIIKKLKATGGILVNGERVHVDRKLLEGEILTIVYPDDNSENIIPEEMNLDIIYEDDDILAVNKPSGIETHPSKQCFTGTLANGVVHYFKGNFTFRVITRLDKETSGVVLIAKNVLSAHRLNEAMRRRKIKKEYVAVVEGRLDTECGVIDVPIKRGEGIRRVAQEGGKDAVTEYVVEKVSEKLTLVRLKPLTGRTHQIRVHLAHIGVPICGDWLYGEARAGERVRLHCARIEIKHPSGNKMLTIEAPVPKDITCLVK